jgi:type VI secretion system protein ImpE
MYQVDARELIKDGNLSEARSQLIQDVKNAPGDLASRVLLLQVLFYCGEWNKAENHLATIGSLDIQSEIGVQVYKNLVHAEKVRSEVAALKRRPEFLPETPTYAEHFFLGRELLYAGKNEEASKVFQQVGPFLPPLSGRVNDEKFSGIKNTDDFLGPFLEAMVHERYLWIPFEAIRELVITPPKTLLDLLWKSAQITCWDGLSLNCYLPVLYPQTFQQEDDRLKLGRMTDWLDLGGGLFQGVGQQVLQIGEGEMALLAIREIVFSHG